MELIEKKHVLEEIHSQVISWTGNCDSKASIVMALEVVLATFIVSCDYGIVNPTSCGLWGKYGNDPDYKLVPSVTDIAQCKNDPYVPKTDTNVSKLVYIFMAILMACGIGFIYYSTSIKKHD